MILVFFFGFRFCLLLEKTLAQHRDLCVSKGISFRNSSKAAAPVGSMRNAIGRIDIGTESITEMPFCRYGPLGSLICGSHL